MFGVNEDQQFIVMELMLGNLEELIKGMPKNNNNLEYDKFVKNATCQLMAAYGYLHSPPIGIMHRDVKPQNILYCKVPGEQFPRLKLCDFAFSRLKEEMAAANSTTCVISKNQSIRWAPPEMKIETASCPHDPEKVDIWSLGHVLFYIARRGKEGIFTTESNFNNHDVDVDR